MTKPLEKLIITQKFGARPEYYGQWGFAGHEGTDFRTKNLGTSQGWFSNLMGWQKVFAVESGRVTVEYATKGYGTHIYLHADSGRTFLYAHLKNARCSTGQRVMEGDIIAVSGNTGNSTSSHLHFSYRPVNFNVSNGYGGWEDPMKLFKPVMNYTVINTDPNLMEQARKLLVQYSGGLLDCNFIYSVLPPIVSPDLFPTDEQILFLKNYPVTTPFCFLTYSSLADQGMVNMVTKGTPNYQTIVTACKGTPTAFNICYEMVHAMTFYLMDKGYPVGLPDDVNTPDEKFLKAKVDKLVPFLNGGVII